MVAIRSGANNDIYLQTNGTDRIMIDSNGKVGLNNSAPSEYFDASNNTVYAGGIGIKVTKQINLGNYQPPENNFFSTQNLTLSPWTSFQPTYTSITTTASAVLDPYGNNNAYLISVSTIGPFTTGSFFYGANIPYDKNYEISIWLKASTISDVGKYVYISCKGSNMAGDYITPLYISLPEYWTKYTVFQTQNLFTPPGNVYFTVYIPQLYVTGNSSVNFLAAYPEFKPTNEKHDFLFYNFNSIKSETSNIPVSSILSGTVLVNEVDLNNLAIYPSPINKTKTIFTAQSGGTLTSRPKEILSLDSENNDINLDYKPFLKLSYISGAQTFTTDGISVLSSTYSTYYNPLGGIRGLNYNGSISWNSTTGNITVPTSGIYYISFTPYINGTNGRFVLQKNGSTTDIIQTQNYLTTNKAFKFATMLYLNANDYINIVTNGTVSSVAITNYSNLNNYWESPEFFYISKIG